MPISEHAVLGGLLGATGGVAINEALEPLFRNWTDTQRYLLLFAMVFLLFLWFVLLPGGRRRR